MARCDRDVNVGDVEGWGSEASGIIDGRSAGGIGAIADGSAVLLRNNEKPCNGEGRSICGVDERIANVERCQGEAVEGRLPPDMRGEQGGQDESQERVDVHGQLK